MRWLASVCALVIGASLGGCALIEAERNNRGGFLDQWADDVWMKADSKKMRALRAVALEASLGRIAMIAPKNASDRALLARRIGETSKRADIVRRCAFSTAPMPALEGRRPDEPCFIFDSVMVDYENALFDLALIALPIDEAKKLINRVSGGIASISVNPLELVQTLIDIGREAFRYGRVVGAIYRDTLELEVQVWLSSPGFAESERARGVPDEFIVTADKVVGLRAIYARGNDNIPAWRAEIAALRAQGLEPVPDHRFITELYSILAYICGQIVSTQDDSYKECAFKPSGVQNVPAATGPGGRLFGPGMSTESRSARAKEQELKEDLRQKDRELQQLKQQQQRFALNRTERDMKAFDLRGYKQVLCVTGADATTDSFDTQTRERLREFVSGVAWASALTQNTPVVIDQTVEERLKRAITISSSCSTTSFISSAYELGVYARSGVTVAEKEIENALKELKLNDVKRGREAMRLLRGSFEQPPQSPAGAAQPGAAAPVPAAAPAASRDDLDPALWAFIVQKSVEFKRRNGPMFPR